MEQVEVLADRVDDVPDLVHLIREDRDQLESAVSFHPADRLASVALVVAEVHSGSRNGFG